MGINPKDYMKKGGQPGGPPGGPPPKGGKLMLMLVWNKLNKRKNYI